MGRLVLAALTATVAIATVTAGPGTAHACSCSTYDPVAAYRDASAVFVGEAIEVRNAPPGDPMAGERRYVFQVSDVYKGEVPELQSVVSPVGDEACGLPWDQAGAIAIVFGTALDTGLDTVLPGELATTSCTTGALGPASIVAEFGERRPPVAGASPVGIPPAAAAAGGEVRLSWEWVGVGALVVAGVGVGLWPRRRAAGRLDS